MRLLARHARIAALSLALAGVSVGGCKKDEPAPPAPAAQADAAGGAAAGGAAGTPQPGADAGQAGGQAGLAPTTGPAPVAAAPAIAAPESVVVVAGIPSLEGALGDFSRLANEMAPGQVPPTLGSMAVENLKESIGVTDITWLDQKAPIKLLVVNPKVYANGAVLVLPTTDREKVLASLPTTAQKDVDGHAASWEHRFTTWYLDFSEGAAVLSQHKDVFAQVKDFVAGGLKGWTPGTPVAVQLNMENVNRLFGAEMEELKRMLKQTYSQMQQQEEFPGANKAMEQNVDAIFAFIEQSKQIDFTLSAPPEAMQIGLGVTGKDGTALATFIRESAANEPTLTAHVPATSWLGFAANMDSRKVEALKQLQQSSFGMYAQLLKMTPEEQARLTTLMEQAWQVSTGDSVFSVFTDGRFPLAMLSAARVTDAAQAKTTYDALFGLLFEKVWALAKEEMAKEGTQIPGNIDVKTFGDLAKLASELGAPYGVKVDVASSEEGEAKIESIKIDIDWEKSPLKTEDPEAYTMLKDVVGNHVELAMAFQGQMTAMALGPNAIKQATAAVAGAGTAGEATLTQAARGNLFAMALRVGAAFEAFSFVPDLQNQRAAIEAIPKDQSFVLAGDSNGQQLVVSATVPAPLVRALSKFGESAETAPAPPTPVPAPE